MLPVKKVGNVQSMAIKDARVTSQTEAGWLTSVVLETETIPQGRASSSFFFFDGFYSECLFCLFVQVRLHIYYKSTPINNTLATFKCDQSQFCLNTISFTRKNIDFNTLDFQQISTSKQIFCCAPLLLQALACKTQKEFMCPVYFRNRNNSRIAQSNLEILFQNFTEGLYK